VHSFPEAALEAWLYRSPEPVAPPEVGPPAPASKVAEPEPEEPEELTPDQRPPLIPYSLENVIAEGCFLGRDTLERMLRTLRGKKNLVLQGPPGTGKTWLARRLGFALIGERDESRLRAVQFHPTLSYEDFVRGLRPNADGKLDVVDGVFLRAVEAAKGTPTVPFVVVIEEINRGNPAQILGEMLTLLEADKRTPDQALELMHAKDGKRVHIPPNLHVIGTMNIADRSLALVDLALRRRFAFVELEPQLGEAWRRWVTQRCRVAEALADEVQRRIQTLNERIAADTSLGRQFRVGHSFVTPPTDPPAAITAEWFKLVVETEIGPLLEEYWYDQPRMAAEANAALLKGL
jgi:5-methylcytosine-specific restriction enzyme B